MRYKREKTIKGFLNRWKTLAEGEEAQAAFLADFASDGPSNVDRTELPEAKDT